MLPVFFSDEDRAAYLALIREGCERHGVTCLAWCLMDNWTCNGFVPVTYLIMPPWPRMRAG